MRNLQIGLLLIIILALPVRADEDNEKKEETKLSAGTFSGIKLRNIGPALMSGRIADIAIDPIQPNTWYVAAGSGNLWKTVNAGTTWRPIFDNYGSYSIGCVTIDPSNHHVIWVGTGENVGGRHVGYGDGVYKSVDGGKSFKNMGLKDTEHLSKIIVDPRDSDTVYVASQGPLWSAGGQRGLYKTTDGGENWKLILSKGPYTGVTDVAYDPRDPDVLYAATHQRHRTVWALVNAGPESGIHKSVNGGETWRELKSGLPSADKGKMSLAVSPVKADVVYATIELAGRKGGFWRSENAGESWTKMSDYISGGTGPHYYQEIYCDPHRFDVIYQANVRLARTEDGGKTWQTVESRWKHVDNHAVVFHPKDPDFLLVGCDGGLYRSFDRGKTYQFFPNLPLTQFYKVDVDYDEPFYHVVGGTQDNATQYGPARTGNSSGIRNSDWKAIIGGDGHDCAIDPCDPNIVYCESQQGYLRRYDRRAGESVGIRPRPPKGEKDLRFNWDSPILISPHSHKRIYYGSKRLHRSDDRGDSWTAISPDLSRNRDRYKLKHMDRVWSIDAAYDTGAMSQYGNITSISESPLESGLIYVGTDDGLIQVTEDAGRNWRKIERIYGVPEEAFVNDVKADLHDVDTVYAVLDSHKTGDFKPYLVRSEDRGRTWDSITGDLPDRQILWRFTQDHVDPNLYFLGAEFGLYFSLDRGKKWIKLKGNVPTIPFRDIEIQRRENDLVGASFGRSFFVLDDYSFLREIGETTLDDEEFILFGIRKTRLYVPGRALGSEKGSQGDGFFTAPNPPSGAVLTYYLKSSLKTLKQKRGEREAKVKKQGGDNPYPGWKALEQERREESPSITFVIRDTNGNVVNRVAGPTSAGFHRVSWNLRYASLSSPGRSGPLVTPGKYIVSAEKRVRDEITPLGGPQSVEVVPMLEPSLPVQNRNSVLQFYMTAGELQRAVRGANGKVDEVLSQLDQIKQAIRQSSKGGPELLEQARGLDLKLKDIRETLGGGSVISRHDEPDQLSIMNRINGAMSGAGSTYGPTKTNRQDYEIAKEEFESVRGQAKRLIETDFVNLQKDLETAGVPWTSGRPIPRLEE
ncbi:MAG: glycosyl hydrolase [Candidatus Zixiibacteriota bacterium]|nr:MAG: glycosyl hydrolase [candidate division Zixibacteria bacterium]